MVREARVVALVVQEAAKVPGVVNAALGVDSADLVVKVVPAEASADLEVAKEDLAALGEAKVEVVLVEVSAVLVGSAEALEGPVVKVAQVGLTQSLRRSTRMVTKRFQRRNS